MYIGLHVPSVDCNDTNFLNRFPKNPQVSNIMKIRPVGAELFQPDERTHTTKLIVAFRNLANATKISEGDGHYVSVTTHYNL
jgi:hypothetical protein